MNARRRLIISVAVVVTVAAAALAAALLAGGSGGQQDRPAADATNTKLTFTVWPDGAQQGRRRQFTLSCDLTRPSKDAPGACEELGKLKLADFAPVARNARCTMQFGGPDEARVRGTLRGHRIDARFDLRNGCQIARWEKLSYFLGVAGRTPKPTIRYYENSPQAPGAGPERDMPLPPNQATGQN